MGTLDVAGMAAIETEKAKRAEMIRKLTEKPFDHTNEAQMDTLKEIIDNFESSTNLMYIYQAVTWGAVAWGASFVFARILPIPDIINMLLNSVLVMGIGTYLLKNHNIKDYHSQLSEMKYLYNWCLKMGNANYDENNDNTNALLNPQIQRMIRLMAPLCSTEFMMAWRRETDADAAHGDQNNGYVASVLSIGYSVMSAPFSLFSKSGQPNAVNALQQLQLQELKSNVETRKYDLNDYTRFKQAIDYFMTQVSNTEYKKFLWTKWEDLKSKSPTPIAVMLTSPKLD